MATGFPSIDFQHFWRRLQQIGLNAYEARAYLVLIGHPRFKALELASRASVPRQKIYEVLDSLVEKGFAQVVQEKTKLFSAIEPALSVSHYLQQRQRALEQEHTEQSRRASALVEDLDAAYSHGKRERGTLDFLRIITDPGQTAATYRRMLSEVSQEYAEFSRPPYAVDPLEEQLVKDARQRGVACRLILESARLDDDHRQRLTDYVAAGVEVRLLDSVPMKLAVFDTMHGLIALLDPVITRPAWTTIVFEHPGMGQAMKGLFEDHWRRAAAM